MRVLADAYAVQGTYGGRLDGSRIGDGLAALGAAEFEASLNQLATSLMRDPSATSSHLHRLSTGQEEMLSMMLGSGTYGTQSTVARRRLEGVAGDDGNPDDLRRRYLVRRLFPSREAMGGVLPRLPLALDASPPSSTHTASSEAPSQRVGQSRGSWRVLNLELAPSEES